ncbi:MAG: hypothetical protein ACI31G_03475 [Bacilli bacterium]
MGNGKKIAGLVLGICGVVCAFIGFAVPVLDIVGLPVSIVGLVLAIVGNKQYKTGLGTAAFVVSLIAVIFTAITFFTCGICVIVAAGTLNAAGQVAGL